jgi:gliding motility-associated-like protein
MTNIPLQDACIFQPWIHNPGAVDLDGDSLSYELVIPQGIDCQQLGASEYVFPDRIPMNEFPNPDNQISIDPLTGTVSWISPQKQGEYNIAILITEWRNGIFLGSVLRDMQIDVKLCDNLPPVIEEVRDTCIEAGQTLEFDVFASDPNGGLLTLSALGTALNVPSSPATLDQNNNNSPVSGTFSWNTNCSHVRISPYQTNFQVTDNGPGVSLVDITTMNITVVAPAPENLVAEAVGSSIALSWEPSICSEAVGYRIYRRINFFGFVPDVCETGVPEYTGYSQIAEISGLNNVTYLDEDEIIFGRENCYMVIAYFADGAESYASNEACAEIRLEIPIIKQNSVGITSTTGVDSVSWRSPIDLDEEFFPGPYSYRLLRGVGYDDPTEEVFSAGPEANLDDLPDSFISQNLNTEDTAHTYRIELYSGETMAARSNRASSLFIELIPDDNQIAIQWQEELPWINFRYDVFRQTDGTGSFDFIGSTDEIGYVDSNLVNNRFYCYYIVSHGSYFAVEENDTLVNFSQRTCAQPYDRTPPCPPVLELEGDCVDFTLDLQWTNPNIECPETDDVMQYNVYFSPTEGSDFELLEVIDGDFNTDLSLIFENSIAGCYAVTALDSLAAWPDGELRRNESEFSNVICIDNCPEYTLPNVFTPNGDGRNDILLAFPYRSIESVEFTLFNRWGSIVFETTDPDINWDGTNQVTGELVSSSTYFYTCKVFSIRLSGLEPISLSGYVQVFSSGTGVPNE